MIDFIFEEDLVESAETAQGGSFGVLDTGIYDVTINFASLDKTAGGNNTLALDITTSTGHRTTIWSSFGTIDKAWVSGKENFGYKDFQSFMAAVGAKSITPVPYALKKDDGTLIKQLSVVKELHEKKMKLAIQKEYDVYNGQVKEKNVIHSSYNAKGQTYLEAKSNEPADKINKVLERLKDKESKAYKAHVLSGTSPFIEDISDDDLL
jgi:hypothetical protein